MDDQQAVIVKDLFKTFKLPHEKHTGMKQAVVGLFHGKRGYEIQKVLNDVSFNIKKGEFFGIVGRNGSGKSTLLKLLAGIYVPDKGLVHVNGSLTPFIELGVGFNPELTGRENVFMNGALLGFSRPEMENMYGEIVDFAEIGEFMDQKLKNYSSGMQVRLAFSIAIRANTPILLIDEVLAVGDSDFQNKCYAEFRKMKESGRTIIFVTHDMSAVERFCDRVLVLQKGRVKGVYSPTQAAVIYEKMNAMQTSIVADKSAERWGSGKVRVKDVVLLEGGDLTETNVINQGEDVVLKIETEDDGSPYEVVIGLAIHDMFGVNMAGPNSHKLKLNSKQKTFTYTMPKISLVPGKYIVTVAIFDKNIEEEFDHLEQAVQFSVISDQLPQHGKINLFGLWK